MVSFVSGCYAPFVFLPDFSRGIGISKEESAWFFSIFGTEYSTRFLIVDINEIIKSFRALADLEGVEGMRVSPTLYSFRQKLCQTRMHFSRMHTTSLSGHH